ncbi:MAG: hypothetical protein PHF60_00225 [Candidatus ainarchaeum sp.]|nr:hypothetical protein [Candidatus ainarchaeum sp.]
MGYVEDAMRRKAAKEKGEGKPSEAAKPAVATSAAPAAMRLDLPNPLVDTAPAAAKPPVPPALPAVAPADEGTPAVPQVASAAAPVRAAEPASRGPGTPPVIPAAPRPEEDELSTLTRAPEEDGDDDLSTLVAAPEGTIVKGPDYPDDHLLEGEPVGTFELEGPGSIFAGIPREPEASAPAAQQAAAPASVPFDLATPAIAAASLGHPFFDLGPAAPAEAVAEAPAEAVTEPVADAASKKTTKIIAFMNPGDNGLFSGYKLTYIRPSGVYGQEFRLTGKNIDEKFALRVGDTRTFKAGEATITITSTKVTGPQKEVEVIVEVPEKVKKAKAKKAKAPEENKAETPSKLKQYARQIIAGACVTAVAGAALIAPGVGEFLGAALVPAVAVVYTVSAALVLVSVRQRAKELKEEKILTR